MFDKAGLIRMAGYAANPTLRIEYKPAKHSPNLIPGKDHRQSDGALRPDNAFHPFDVHAKNLPVEEQKGT